VATTASTRASLASPSGLLCQIAGAPERSRRPRLRVISGYDALEIFSATLQEKVGLSTQAPEK
jgi:hypothetical protein